MKRIETIGLIAVAALFVFGCSNPALADLKLAIEAAAGPTGGSGLPLPQLAIPTAVVVSDETYDSITISWESNNTGHDGFRVEVRNEATSETRTDIEVTADETQAVVAGLTSSVSYEFRVLAFNDSVSSDYSVPVSGTTTSPWAAGSPGQVSSRLEEWSYTNAQWTSVSITMKSCPGGTFHRAGDGLEVTVAPLWVASTEVTNAQLAYVFQWAVDTARVSATDADAIATDVTAVSWDGSSFAVDAGMDAHPALSVSWLTAARYANFLTMMADGSAAELVYTNTETGFVEDIEVNETQSGFRIPSRNEWECAARYLTEDEGTNYLEFRYGGGYKENGVYWHSGEETSGVHWISDGVSPDGGMLEPSGDYAWYWSNSGLTSHAVATVDPNWLGIYDMSGNAAEWCSDEEVISYPEGDFLSHWYRGGSFEEYAVAIATNSAGTWYEESSGNAHRIGFRVVRTP